MGWVPTTDAERADMLAAIGVSSLDDLFKAIPELPGMVLPRKFFNRPNSWGSSIRL